MSNTETQYQLQDFNRQRFAPRLPHQNESERSQGRVFADELKMKLLEWDYIGEQRAKAKTWLRNVLHSPHTFVDWFQNLQYWRPGSETALFDWIRDQASVTQIRWFLHQELAGEAGFDDLVTLTQLRFEGRARIELGRNLWDELGRGHLEGMHGAMLNKLAKCCNLPIPGQEVVVESIQMNNLMIGLAANRSYAYHSIGALGAIELTAPRRASSVSMALKRLDIADRHYYTVHSTLDKKHAQRWMSEIIVPLIEKSPAVCSAIAEGAVMRLLAGARCFQRYRSEWGLKPHESTLDWAA